MLEHLFGYVEVRVDPLHVVQVLERLHEADELARGLTLDPLISDCLPLEQLPEAMRRLHRGDGIQYAIDPWAEALPG